MPTQNDKYLLLRTFCSVVHFGSFSSAASYLGIPVSSVSKHIKRLEDQLKVQLMVRTTRSMCLTDAGALYFEKGRKVLKELDQLEHDVQALSRSAEGVLRVSLPLMIGEQILSPLLSEFIQNKPDIRLVLDYSHEPSNLIEQDFDIAFRTSTHLPDSALFEIKLLELQPVYVAAPEYLRQYGSPYDQSDLINHHRLEFNPTIKTEDIDSSKSTERVLSNSYQSLITAAKSGCGIVCVYDILVAKALETRELVRVLQHSEPEKKYLSLLYRQRSNTSKKLQSFVNFFIDHPRLDANK